MIEKDTVKLLRECDAGVKMGIGSIADVVAYASSQELKKYLTDCKREHEALGDEIEALLSEYNDEGKDPNPIAEGMSWLKTNVMLGMKESDQTIADLITDGCNMGVKSLNRYLNQYEAADEKSKNIAKRLISIEAGLAEKLRAFL